MRNKVILWCGAIAVAVVLLAVFNQEVDLDTIFAIVERMSQ